jgi:hypothetical protein
LRIGCAATLFQKLIFKTYILHLHFHSFDLDSPGVCCLVEAALHDVRDGLALGEDLGQVLGAEHVAKGGRSQQAGRVAK